jgi:hypothetical protein
MTTRKRTPPNVALVSDPPEEPEEVSVDTAEQSESCRSEMSRFPFARSRPAKKLGR